MAYDRTPLPAEELAKFLKDHPDWKVAGKSLERTYELPTFPAAIAFVTQVGFIAEKHDHHPDIDVRWRKVKLSLTTHDAGGLTFRDPAVASECDALR
jgi:4a-hydroxytetrahydrobiopterin dehydratase